MSFSSFMVDFTVLMASHPWLRPIHQTQHRLIQRRLQVPDSPIDPRCFKPHRDQLRPYLVKSRPLEFQPLGHFHRFQKLFRHISDSRRVGCAHAVYLQFNPDPSGQNSQLIYSAS